MQVTPGPKRPFGGPNAQPAAEGRKVKAPVYGRHGPGRNLSDALKKLTGNAPPPRTLEQVGVSAQRLEQLDQQLASSGIKGWNGESAEDIVSARALEMRKDLKATANNFGANANLRAYGGAGLSTSVFQQTADQLGLSSDATKPLKNLPYAASLVHGSAAASAAPSPHEAQLVPGKNAKPVSAGDVAKSADPFGMRMVKDKALARIAVTVATDSGAVPKPAAQLAGSVLGFLSGQRAASKLAEIVFARRGEGDWSVQTPRLEANEVVALKTAHAVAEDSENGSAELGNVQMFKDGKKVTVHIGTPTETAPSIRSEVQDGVSAPEKKTFGSRTKEFVRSLPTTLPSPGTAIKLSAQMGAVWAAGKTGQLANKGVSAVLKGTDLPPTVSSSIAAVTSGVATDAAFSGSFVPGFQSAGDPVENAGDAVKKAALAGTPGANLLGTGPTGREDNFVFDDVMFAPAASNEVEMYTVLEQAFPGSVEFNPVSKTLDIGNFEALWQNALKNSTDLN